ncbi:hypothetical protein C9374_008194 [Naegleria lovaniensis]|uniref:Ras-GEF domain-containing protein n=1 Tax=Naegleria lovaniensis TaxID=51637 RepID=A0AA88GK36_NAELO|nr:uncharacterized protein C9374_008194 [Naegleria lovaniensis]KAG2378555.1 hypothetical protein C9374_008194 [Naegleria lovaniensis]
MSHNHTEYDESASSSTQMVDKSSASSSPRQPVKTVTVSSTTRGLMKRTHTKVQSTSSMPIQTPQDSTKSPSHHVLSSSMHTLAHHHSLSSPSSPSSSLPNSNHLLLSSSPSNGQTMMMKRPHNVLVTRRNTSNPNNHTHSEHTPPTTPTTTSPSLVFGASGSSLQKHSPTSLSSSVQFTKKHSSSSSSSSTSPFHVSSPLFSSSSLNDSMMMMHSSSHQHQQRSKPLFSSYHDHSDDDQNPHASSDEEKSDDVSSTSHFRKDKKNSYRSASTPHDGELYEGDVLFRKSSDDEEYSSSEDHHHHEEYFNNNNPKSSSSQHPLKNKASFELLRRTATVTPEIMGGNAPHHHAHDSISRYSSTRPYASSKFGAAVPRGTASSLAASSIMPYSSVGSILEDRDEGFESDPESISDEDDIFLESSMLNDKQNSPMLVSSPRAGVELATTTSLSSSPTQKQWSTQVPPLKHPNVNNGSAELLTSRNHTKGMYYRMLTGAATTREKNRKLVSNKNIFGLPMTFSKQPSVKSTVEYKSEEYLKEMLGKKKGATTPSSSSKQGAKTPTTAEESSSTDTLEDMQDKLVMFHKIQYSEGALSTTPGRSFLDVPKKPVSTDAKKEDPKKKTLHQTDSSPATPSPRQINFNTNVKKYFYKVNAGTCATTPSSVSLNTDNIDKKQFEVVYWTTYKDLAEEENIIDSFFVSNFSAMDLLYKLFYNNSADPKRKKKLKVLYNAQVISEQLDQLKDIYKQVTKLRMCTLVKQSDNKLRTNQLAHQEKLNVVVSEDDSSDEDDGIELVLNEKGEIDIFSMKNIINNLDLEVIHEISHIPKDKQRNITVNAEVGVATDTFKSDFITLKDLESEDRFDISAKISQDAKIEFYTIRNWLTKILAAAVNRKKKIVKDNISVETINTTDLNKTPRIDSTVASPVTATLLNMAVEKNEVTTTLTDDSQNLSSDYDTDPDSLHRWQRKSVIRKGPLENDTPKLEMLPTELLDYMMSLSCSASTLFDTLEEWEVRIHALFAFLETLTLQTPHQLNCILIFLGDLILYNQSLMSSEFIHECLIPYLNTILKKPESIPFVDLFLKRITERSQLLFIRDQAQRTINLAFDNFSSKSTLPDFLTISSFQLSIQLTLIEFDLFTMMEPYEFYCSYWLSKNRFKVKTRDPSPNLSLFIQWYNTVSLWVTETILQYNDIKERHKALCRFISLAWGCFSVRNYNGCFEIITGLYSNEVYRLSKTWAMLSDEYLKKAQTLIDLTSVANNYRNYREELKNSKKPCIPNLAVHLKDLASVDDSQEDERKLSEEEMRLLAENDQFCKQVFIGRTLDEDIEYNFSKRRLQTTLICQLLKYQKTSYPFKPNESLKHYLWISLLRINEDIRRETTEKKISIEKYIQEKKRQFLVRSKQLEPKSTR